MLVCQACTAEVDPSRVVRVAGGLLGGGTEEPDQAHPEVLGHIVYLEGVVPPAPEVAFHHVGPMVCGPLKERP